MRYVALGITRDRVLELTRLTRHQYYYKPKKGRRAGRSPSKKTFQIIDGDVVSLGNESVIKSISNNHSDPDLSYGCRRMTCQLQQEGFIINHKKVNRLMKENHLLALKKK